MVSKYYSTKEHNFDSLSSGYFFMNRPDAFNDPFDCRSIIYFQGSDKQWKDYFKKKGYDSEKVNTLVKEYSGKRIYADFIKQHQFEKIDHAIACFADSENNPLMWSHYADSHKGFCIRFITQSIDNTQTIKIKKSQLKLSDEYSDSLFILPVTYISRMPEEYNVFSYNINDLVKFYTTKGTFWEYEKEHRAVYQVSNLLNENRKVFYDKSSVDSIFLGVNINNIHRERIIRIVRDNYKSNGFNPKLYQCHLSPNYYNLELRPI